MFTVDIITVDGDFAGGRPDQPRYHLDQCAFPGAVGTEQGENIVLADIHADILDAMAAPVFLCKSTALKHLI